MKKALKTKKALKRLDRVDALLSKVIDQDAADELGIRELLESARASVGRAQVKAKPLAGKAKSPAKKAKAKAKAKAKSAVKVVKAKAPGKSKRSRKAKGVRAATAKAAMRAESSAEDLAVVSAV
jgi:hypothetical protein